MPDQRRAWFTIAMLFLFMMINFADKAALGLAAVPIMRDLGLTHAQFGSVGSSFFLLFSITALVVGFVANRVETRWVIGAMALIWSLSQLPLLWNVPLWTLFGSRMLLGAGEGPAYPVALHCAFKWFPDKKRLLPTSIIAIGASVGAGVVAPLTTFLIVTFSWHLVFGVLAAAGSVWAVFWLAFAREGPIVVADDFKTPALTEEKVAYRRLILTGSVIGVWIVMFAAYAKATLYVIWLPSYLIKVLGFSLAQTGWIVVLPALSQILVSPLIAFLSDNMRSRGRSSRVARGGISCACILIAGLALMALPLAPGQVLPVALVMLSTALGGIIFSLGPACIGELCPVAQRGAMLGLTNAIATSAGLITPLVMGMIVDLSANPKAGFQAGFLSAGIVVCAGALAGFILINAERDRALIKKMPARSATAAAPPGRPADSAPTDVALND
jgi:MFS transporter, ACS family, D-galactonate transporter